MDIGNPDRTSKFFLTIIGPQIFVALVVAACYLLLTRVFDVEASDALALGIPTLLISSIAAGFASRSLLKRHRSASPQASRKLVKKTILLFFVACIDGGLILLLTWLHHRNFSVILALFLLLAIVVVSFVLLRVGRSFVGDVGDLRAGRIGRC